MLNYLYSIRARHVADIMNGKKTFELRTKIPRVMKTALDNGEKVVMWIYCTKAEPYLYYPFNRVTLFDKKIVSESFPSSLNGLVVAKCVVDSYEEVSNRFNGNEWVYDDWLLNVTCLDENQLDDYLKQDGNYRFGYALHLTQVEILDKPMTVQYFGLTRAPQSYQKVKAPEGKE